VSAAEGLFGAAAEAYRAFRPVWPEALFARILGRVPQPRGTAIDLGAGTGLVARRLTREFPQVLAVEPDARMAAEMQPDASLRWLHAAAEEVELPAAEAQLVTIGNAFHWMDGALVAERARGWLSPGGALAVFRYDPPHAASGALEEILSHEYEVAWRAHVHPRLRDPDYARRTLAASSLAPTLEHLRIANDLAFSRAELLGFLRSTSYGGGHARSLPDPEAYWRALEARILEADGAGPHVLDFHVELLLATRS